MMIHRISLFGYMAIVVVLVARGATPADPHATAQARHVLDYLSSLPGKTSNKVISGQYHYLGYTDVIHEETGHWVGLIAESMVNGETRWPGTARAADIQQQYLSYWKAGGLVSDNFKIHNPKSKGLMNDLDFTDADMDAAVTADTPINSTLNLWLDTWATYDRVLQENEVVVIVRPLHEMNCCFWYRRHEPAKFIALWRYIFDYVTVKKGLHNLLFAYSVSLGGRSAGLTYPGNAYVDIVGMDLYKDLTGANEFTAADFALYREMRGYGKPFAITEYGPHKAQEGRSTVKTDYRKLLVAIKTFAPDTVYWMPWSVSWSMRAKNNDHVRELLEDPWVINRDEIPNLK